MIDFDGVHKVPLGSEPLTVDELVGVAELQAVDPDSEYYGVGSCFYCLEYMSHFGYPPYGSVLKADRTLEVNHPTGTLIRMRTCSRCYRRWEFFITNNTGNSGLTIRSV